MTPVKPTIPKLPRAPLIFVLAQVKFTPVLKMESYVPDIQEYLRHRGFPKYRQENISNIIIGSEAKADIVKRWIFEDPENHKQFVLTTESVAFQTTAYDTFDTFLSHLMLATEPLAKYARVELIQQIGLRYVDLLANIDDLKSSELLAPGLRGIPVSAMELQQGAFSFAMQFQTPCGVLTIRSIQLMGLPTPAILPPDIGQISLTFPDWISKAQDPRMLDFDHITQRNIPFTQDALSEELNNLHQYTDRAFRSTSTPEALKAWSRK
jgi:uncharacterized protein (TIGR04255 family)